MEPDRITQYRQELSGILDTLFTRVVSGVTVEANNLDRYHSTILSLTNIIIEISDQVALERCKKLNDAVIIAFGKVEERIELLKYIGYK